jgi:hypothetical protein
LPHAPPRTFLGRKVLGTPKNLGKIPDGIFRVSILLTITAASMRDPFPTR